MSGTSARPAGESAAAAGSAISRRTFIGAAGALGLSAAALPALGAAPAGAAVGGAAVGGAAVGSPAAGRNFLGSNMDVFIDIRDGLDRHGKPTGTPVPGLRGVRLYGRKPTGQESVIPASRWPAGPLPGQQGPIVFSIYPNPKDVVRGKRPAAGPIRKLIASAPPNSYLSAWHEALSLPHPDYITAASLLELHTALNAMCKGTNVTYGSIFGSGDTFDSVPDHLGFYGLDVYAQLKGKPDTDIGMQRLENFIRAAKANFTPSPGNLPPGTKIHYPKLLIGETNIPPTKAGKMMRPAWFGDVCGRMHTYGSNSIGVLTFWSDDGPYSGPWLPGDKKTISEMNHIITKVF